MKFDQNRNRKWKNCPTTITSVHLFLFWPHENMFSDSSIRWNLYACLHHVPLLPWILFLCPSLDWCHWCCAYITSSIIVCCTHTLAYLNVALPPHPISSSGILHAPFNVLGLLHHLPPPATTAPRYCPQPPSITPQAHLLSSAAANTATIATCCPLKLPPPPQPPPPPLTKLPHPPLQSPVVAHPSLTLLLWDRWTTPDSLPSLVLPKKQTSSLPLQDIMPPFLLVVLLPSVSFFLALPPWVWLCIPSDAGRIPTESGKKAPVGMFGKFEVLE